MLQRRLRATLEGEPHRRFTIEELALAVFPGKTIERSQLVSVRRALTAIETHRMRASCIGSGKRGWRYTVSATSAAFAPAANEF